MTAPKAPQQELFKAETAWFHIFKTMIDNGDVARMGPYAVTVYLVIKSHTNFATGRAFPALETIAEKSGVSLAQVKRELKTLEKFGYITTEKKGRSNHYTLREKIEINPKEPRYLKVVWGVGYKVEKISGVDLFPGTYHVETICQLVKVEKNI